MILRKPYAILIKNFKLIHVILSAMMVYLFYRTNSILRFLNEYIGSSQIKIGDTILDELFGPIFIILVVFIVLLTLIIMGLLAFKKKPIKFYIYNIAVYIFSTIVYIIAFYIIQKLQYGLLDVKTLKLLQDFTLVTLLFQITTIIITIVRATGFNIKNFNFEQDLEHLEIAETDNEEFEVNVDLDTDKLLRRIKKKLRYAKYIYVENRLFINILIGITVSVMAIVIYFNTDVYSKTYSKSESFKTVRFILGTNDSYRTKYLNRTKTIDDGYELVVVRINVKRIYSKKIGLNTGRFILYANKNLYYHTIEYKDYLKDLGETYINNNISNDKFDNYILVFKVKENDISNKMILKYTDFTNDDVKINVSPINLNNKKEESSSSLGNELVFKNSIFKNTKLKIDSYEFGDSFKIDYNYCTSTDCYASAEYVNVSATDNYNKTLLKIVGTFSYDETLPIIKNKSMYKFINNYAVIKYKENGTMKTSLTELKEVKPKKTSIDNTYFIEVSNKIKESENIVLEFNIRNKIYSYTIK